MAEENQVAVHCMIGTNVPVSVAQNICTERTPGYSTRIPHMLLDESSDQYHKCNDTININIPETIHSIILRHDYCLAMDEEASIGCGDTRAFCPTEPYNFSSGVPVDAITCDRCAMVTMENWDQRIWLGGEVRWAPFARFEEDEMQLEGSLTA